MSSVAREGAGATGRRSVVGLALLLASSWSCVASSEGARVDASAEDRVVALDAPRVDIARDDRAVPPRDASADADGAPPPDLGFAEDRVDVAAPRDVGDPDAIVGLRVDPPDALLRVTSVATPQTRPLRAMGRTRDGRELPVPALWSVDRPEVLAVDGAGLARTTNAVGGDVVVTARAGTLAATAAVRVRLELSIVAPGASPAAAMAFPETAVAGADAARTPSWVYPANETVFPQNVYKVLFQWRRGGSDRFRVTFESDRVRVQLFTDGEHADCTAARTGLGCFEPSLDVWRYIAGSNPRGSVRVTVDGASSAAPGTYHRSSTLSIAFSRGPVPGAIYYWSTTVEGVRRATVGDAAPTNFLTPAEADRNCVACHTLSRRGNRMAADVGGNNLWIVEASPATPPRRILAPTGRMAIPMFWSTFSTDETRVVTAARGVMTLRRAADGGAINTVPLAARTYGTQPDWALDDRLMAFTLSASDRDRGVAGGRIATVEIRPGDAWGAVRTLVGSGASNDTNQFPSFSWDSRWIAYVHSTGNGQNDLTSDLWLMRADGSAPRPLTRANTVIGNGTVTTPTVQDNMPTWAPSGVPDDYAWVAFSSTRDYGGVLSGASRLGRHEQLWVAAVSLDAIRGTEDPSHPAFRLPFQGLAEDNHRPFWAQDRVGAVCAASGASCGGDVACCAPDTCRAGTCGPACAPSDQPCAANADCCAPGVCVAGTCRAACRPVDGACATDGDCCAPNTCAAGRCIAPACRASGGACARDGDCCAPNTCNGGLCRAACALAGGACATSSDCCAPSGCVAGMCRAACVMAAGSCATDGDCCAPNACRAGVCAAPCRAAATSCASNGDCCSGVCTRGQCAPPPCRITGGSCTSDSECCSGTCSSGGCAPG